MAAAAAAVDDPATRLAVEAERAFLQASGGGCRAPVGALATIAGGALEIIGGYVSADGTAVSIAHRRGPVEAPASLGRALAADLDPATRAVGRRADARAADDQPGGRRVLVTRVPERAWELASELRAAGLEPVLVPTIAVEPERGGELDAAARRLGSYSWVVVTSVNGARAILEAGERVFTPFEASRFAAIGEATRRALEREGVDVDFVPSESAATAIAAELPIEPRERVLVVRGDLASADLAAALRTRGAEADDVVAYRTREAPAGSRALLRAALRGGRIDAVVLTSGSTVRGLCRLAQQESVDLRSLPAVCIGPETAAEARSAGFRVLAVAPAREAAALATATADALAMRPSEIV
jgi:uroporphyrinogen-III synthase